ncbi:MAG: OB-fold nucleic acid binding domain-containing protein, partial [Pseudomonadota bacterium]
HPVEFLAATMTLDMGNTDKLNDFKREAQRLGFIVEIPNVNESDAEFSVDGETIHYALSAVKGVGEQAVNDMIAVRPEGGFHDLSDFAARIDPKSINKRMLENLVSAGAFDCLEENRARVLDAIEQIVAVANRHHEEKVSGQDDMFSAVTGPEPIRLKPIADFEPSDRLSREQSAIGFYLSAHPLDEHLEMLGKLGAKSWVSFEEDVKRGSPVGKLGGTIISKQERNTRTGNRMAILQISDPSGQFEAVCFSETLAQHRDDLEPGSSVVLVVAAEDRPEGVNVRIQAVEPLNKAAANFQGALNVFIRDATPISYIAQQLTPGEYGRGGTVSLFVIDEKSGREVEVKLKNRFVLSPKVASAIKQLPGIIDARLQ